MSDQDIIYKTKWVVAFSDETYGQKDQKVEVEAEIENEETCRPAIDSADLAMSSIKLSEDQSYMLDVSFNYKLGGTGLHNCKNLKSSYQLHAQDPSKSYEQKQFNEEEISNAQLASQTQLQTIEEEENCWFVTVKYGEEAEESRWATLSSQQMCHKPVCEFSPSIELVEVFPNESKDKLLHSFVIDAELNKWCQLASHQVTVSSDTASWSSADSADENGAIIVVQNNHFKSIEFNARVTYTDINGKTEGAEVDYEWDILDCAECCVASLDSSLEFTKDTLHFVDFQQSFTHSYVELCGVPTLKATYGE